jgi:O-methyltransferase
MILSDDKIIEFCKPYAGVPDSRLRNVLESIEYVVNNNIDGDLVEIGVLRGGCIIAMAMKCIQMGVDRKIHLYDTFTGLTEPTDVDVSIAGVTGKDLIENIDPCICNIETVKKNIFTTGYSNFEFHIGDILQTDITKIPKIALLRLDTDWYESTKFELEHFYPHVVENGIVIVDDYGEWLGSKKATDEFMKINKGINFKHADFACIYWTVKRNKTAIVTLVIGKNYQDMFDLYFRPSVSAYCDKYNIDLITITEPFEPYDHKSDLCCQKILIPSQDWAQKYDAICVIDSDILISPYAKNIFDEVTDDKILFANPVSYHDDFYSWIYGYKNKLVNDEYKNSDEKNKMNYLKGANVYTDGDDLTNIKIINEGMVVCKPKYHGEYLKEIYESHDFKKERLNQVGRDNTFLASGEIWWWYKVMMDNKHRYIDNKYNNGWNYYRRLHIEPFDDPQSVIIPTKNYIENSYFCHIGDREYIDMIHFVDKVYFRKPDTTLVVKCGPVDTLGWLLTAYIRAKKFKDIYIVCKDDSAEKVLKSQFPRIQYVNFFPNEMYKFVTEVPDIKGRIIECDSDWIKYKDFQCIIDLFHEDRNDNDLIKVVYH